MLSIIENNLNLNLNQMNDILNNRENYFPPELYKYREINNNKKENEKHKHIDALKNEKVYLSKPDYFNDPYDSLFSINRQKMRENIVKKLKEQIVQKELNKNNIDIPKIENLELLHENINIKDSNIISDLIENNPEVFYTALKNQIKFKVSCFSEIPDSILMWSHYSNHHKGFCIGYDISKIEKKIKKEFYPVFYHETFFPFVKTDEDIKTGKFNSLIKYKDWQYEKEWRLILNEDFVKLKPSKIYLGVKFDEDKYLDCFKEIASELNCKLYKMKMDYSEYKLNEIEIKI